MKLPARRSCNLVFPALARLHLQFNPLSNYATLSYQKKRQSMPHKTRGAGLCKFSLCVCVSLVYIILAEENHVRLLSIFAQIAEGQSNKRVMKRGGFIPKHGFSEKRPKVKPTL